MKSMTKAFLATCLVLAAPLSAQAADYTITVKDKLFEPKELTIPKNEKVKIIVKNLDPAPIEFESHELKREKVIAAGGQATISVGPLKEGSYPFFDEFNEKNTGTIIVK